MRAERGLTLVELLISLVVLGLVGGVTYQLLVSTQRVTRSQSELVNLQSNVRTGVLVVPSELREIGVNDSVSDIVAMNATGIQYRAARGLGFTCQVTPTELRLANSGATTFFGLRTISPGRDSLFLFVEGDPGLSSDDAWVEVPTTSVDPASACGANPAIAVGVPDLNGIVPGGVGAVEVGGPVRPFEVMELRLYASGGRFWLGARSVSAGELSLQPVLGPLIATGFTLDYFNAAGAPTSDPLQVRSIRVAVAGITDQLIGGTAGTQANQYVEDSLVTTITLRNTPLP